MKLLIITAVEQYHKEVFELFKKAGIDNFSGSDIDGYKNVPTLLRTASWFPSEKGGVESSMFFSFTQEEKIESIFKHIVAFNAQLETNNPIKAAVVPIEKYI